MNPHLECYGGMFPDLSTGRFNTLLKGKVFDVLVRRSGFGITERTSAVDLTQWTQCTACTAYPDCYRLSTAKLLLHAVIQEYGVARSV